MTGNGYALAASTLVLALAGIALNYPELLAVALCGLIMLIGAGLWRLRPPAVTMTRTKVPDRLVEGGSGQFTLQISGPRGLRAVQVEVEDVIGGEPVAVHSGLLAAGVNAKADYTLPSMRRGELTLGPLRVSCADPLNIMRTSQEVPGTATTVLVHPRSYSVAPLDIPGSADLEGRSPEISASPGIELHSLRDYSPGDDVRLIDWKATARTGKRMIRVNLVPRFPRGVILLDTAADAYPDEGFDHAVRVVASLGLAALGREYPIDIRARGRGQFTTRYSTDAGQRMLDYLARLTPVAAGGPPLAAEHPIEAPGPNSVLAIVTGPVPDPARLLAARGRFALVVLIRVGGAAGSRQPAARPRPRPGPGQQTVEIVDVSTADDFARARPPAPASRLVAARR